MFMINFQILRGQSQGLGAWDYKCTFHLSAKGAYEAVVVVVVVVVEGGGGGEGGQVNRSYVLLNAK